MENLKSRRTGKPVFRIDKGYLLLTIFLFIIEILIAVYIRDKFIRPYAGDFLVVILIYSFCKSFVNISTIKLAIGVLLFSYAVEFSQYFQLIKILDLEHSTIAKIILGNSFSWMDMLVYTLGIIVVVLVENYRNRTNATALHSSRT